MTYTEKRNKEPLCSKLYPHFKYQSSNMMDAFNVHFLNLQFCNDKLLFGKIKIGRNRNTIIFTVSLELNMLNTNYKE